MFNEKKMIIFERNEKKLVRVSLIFFMSWVINFCFYHCANIDNMDFLRGNETKPGNYELFMAYL